MDRNRRWGIVGVLGAAACLTVLLVQSSAEESGVSPSNARFLKVGPYRINVDRITYTKDDGDATVVQFGDGTDPGLRLAGDESRALRAWLDNHSQETIIQTRRRKPVMEGVDINAEPGRRLQSPAPRPR